MQDRLGGGRRTAVEAVPLVVTLAGALLVYTRFSHRVSLNRDEGIYVYSAIRLTHGVAPYRSIWDPKTPGASFLGALAVELGRVVGLQAVTAIRLVFFATGVLTALALYLLGRLLWGSTVAGLIGAGVFLCFPTWAFLAIGGPDAKMPGIFLVVLSLALVVRRRWFAAGFAAGLGFLFWQPLLVFVAVGALAALLDPGAAGVRERVRGLGAQLVGAAIPFVACCAYFAAVGSLRIFLDAAFVQPYRASPPYPGLGPSVRHVQMIITRYEAFDMWTFWIGIGLVLAAALLRLGRGVRSPLAAVGNPLDCAVALALLAVLAFSARDFQNFPDLEPLLFFPGLGFGGLYVGVRSLLTRRTSAGRALAWPALCGAATVVLLAVSVAGFDDGRGTGFPTYPTLAVQQAQACALNRIAGRGVVYSFGDPVTLALAGRVNPDNFIYFSGGVLGWKLEHLPHGVAGWKKQILAAHPTAYTSQWTGPYRDEIFHWLRRRGDRFTWIGATRTILTPHAYARAQRLGIHFSSHETLLHGHAQLARATTARCA